MNKEKSVDESWKDSVAQEKGQKQPGQENTSSDNAGNPQGQTGSQQEPDIEINFLNYVSSLVFQAMIFLGELPNPVNDNKIEKNLKQARFLIDTLVMMRDKTRGNLSQEEEKFIEGALAELQMKYVELAKADETTTSEGASEIS